MNMKKLAIAIVMLTSCATMTPAAQDPAQNTDGIPQLLNIILKNSELFKSLPFIVVPTNFDPKAIKEMLEDFELSVKKEFPNVPENPTLPKIMATFKFKQDDDFIRSYLQKIQIVPTGDGFKKAILNLPTIEEALELFLSSKSFRTHYLIEKGLIGRSKL